MSIIVKPENFRPTKPNDFTELSPVMSADSALKVLHGKNSSLCFIEAAGSWLGLKKILCFRQTPNQP